MTENPNAPFSWPENMVLSYDSTAMCLVDAEDRVIIILPRGRSREDARKMADALGLNVRMSEISVEYKFKQFATKPELTRYNYNAKKRGA